ncbi:MAG: glycerophosphodiester phosphodiesterase family protein, partial [Bacteroidales bacterium]|nr:glycerophosphodiester phosphodiesterase family protein [Bacteroidales bacterium]
MASSCCNGAKEPERIEHKWTASSFEELQEFFRYSPGKDLIISGHRGGMQEGFPENCIPSCEKTLSMMPTFFEIDFSFSKDSVMMLMHDLTLDRTTTGKGTVEEMTREELSKLKLVDRQGNVTDYTIPTLQEVLEWGQDKVIFNFDNKYINTKGVSEERKKAALDFYIRQLSEGGEWHKFHNIMLSTRSY